MPTVNLSGMSVEALMDLRVRVDEMLLAEIERQLKRMDRAFAVVGRGGSSALRGKKVPPKYRGPSGETWAGRGAKPRWLVAAIKGGKCMSSEHFGQLAWQFKRMSGSSGLKVQAAIAC